MTMSQVQVVLFTHKGFYDELIRIDSGSEWTHAALKFGDRFLEAYPGVGVRWRDILPGDLDPSVAQVFTVAGMTDEISAAAQDFAVAQLGKPYDWKGIVGISVHEPNDKYDAWFCSKLVFEALRIGGIPLLQRITCGRVRPSEISYSPLLS